MVGLPLGEVCVLLAGLDKDSFVLGIGTFGPLLNGSVTDGRRVEIRLGRRSPLSLPTSSSRSQPDSQQHGVTARDGQEDEFFRSSAATDISEGLRATTLASDFVPTSDGVLGVCETTGINGSEEEVENEFKTGFGRDFQKSPQSIDLQGCDAHSPKLAFM